MSSPEQSIGHGAGAGQVLIPGLQDHNINDEETDMQIYN